MREALLTKRLLLRDVARDDAELLFDLDSDPEVMRYIGPAPVFDLTSYRERIQTVFLPQQAHPWHGIRIVLDRASEEFLGWVFARPANKSSIAPEMSWKRGDEIEMGFRFRRAAWGRGFATEASQALLKLALADPATAAIVACAHADNSSSLRVLEKLGLTRIGELTRSGDSRPTVKLARMRQQATGLVLVTDVAISFPRLHPPPFLSEYSSLVFLFPRPFQGASSCRVPSLCLPANGPICRLRSWPRASRVLVTTASSWPAGATTSRSIWRWPSKTTAPAAARCWNGTI